MSGTGWIAGTNPTDERLRRFGQLVFECCKYFERRRRVMTADDCAFCIKRAWKESEKGN